MQTALSSLIDLSPYIDEQAASTTAAASTAIASSTVSTFSPSHGRVDQSISVNLPNRRFVYKG